MKRKQNKNRKWRIAGIVSLFVVLFLITCDSRLKTVTYTVESDKLSEPVRIALLTDLHSCRYGENQKNLINAVKAQNPDIVLLGGDIFDDKVPHKNAELTVKQLAEQYPCYYVTGNHEARVNIEDEIDYVKLNENVIALHNEDVLIEKGESTIQLIGVDDPDYRAVKDSQEYMNERLEKYRDNESFKILLSHRPELFRALLRSK